MRGDFLIDISPDIDIPEYELELHSLNGEPITSLKNITGLMVKPKYVGLDEIEFNIPLYISTNSGVERNKLYDLVDGEYLILLNNSKYFIISGINEDAEDDGTISKSVLAYSREYEFSRKKLVGYDENSRMLYDETNSILGNIERGILNYILNDLIPSWSIGHVDPDAVAKDGNNVYRALSFSNSNLLQVFKELQETFKCVFEYDTINRKINIYSINNVMGRHSGLSISDRNFIESVSKEMKVDEIITRLYVYGKNDISIHSVSPTGQPYIDNFNYFKNTRTKDGKPRFMSQGLIDAIDAYGEKLDNNTPEFDALLEQLNIENQILDDLINHDEVGDNWTNKGLVALKRELTRTQTIIDATIYELGMLRSRVSTVDGSELSSLHEQIKTTEDELEENETHKSDIQGLIDIKNLEIEQQEAVIEDIYDDIYQIQVVLGTTNNFTKEQLKEFDSFIRVDVFTDTNYTEHNIVELYEEADRLLNKISQPQIQFDVNVVDFLSIVEFEHTWDKLRLGEVVTLSHDGIGFEYDVHLVGYEHNQEENELRLLFSNTGSFDDSTLYLADLIEHVDSVSNNVNFNRFKWDKIDDVESNMSNLIGERLDAAKENILNAVGQKYLFDDRGLWLYAEDEYGKIKDGQIRAINDTIALTTDNWKSTPTWALDPTGINAEIIRGKLGEFARITANQVEVGNSGDTIIGYIEGQMGELDDVLADFEVDINRAFSDNVITNIEANSLDLTRNALASESADVIAIAENLNVPVGGLSTALSNLNNEIDSKYVGQASYPIEVTPIERTHIKNLFSTLQNAITQVYKEIEENREVNTRGYVDEQVGELNTAVDELSGVLDGAFSDNVITNIEASSLKIAFESVKSEALDVINVADGLGLMTSVEKTNCYQALTALSMELSEYIDKDNYPIDITVASRESVVSGFRSLESAIAALLNAIELKRKEDTEDYIDTQVGEANDAISNLDSTINTAFSDSSITNIEANSLSLARDTLVKEAGDIISIANSLGISTTSATSALNRLNTEVNKYVGKANYPIAVSANNRTAINSAFINLENAITSLYSAIDKTSLKEGQNYNGVTINKLDGVKVYRTDGKVETKLNATEGISIYSDTGSGLQRNFYVDTNGKIIAKHLEIDNTSIYDGIVTTDQLVTGTAKIDVGMIDKLIVGENVEMGANARISWANVNNKPNIPDDDYITSITKDTVTTTYLKSLNLEVGNEIQMGANAKISWANVDGKPYIPTSTYITNITKDTITTTYLKSLNLTVGNEINMGANARISWANVDSKPSIPTTTQITNITKDTITTSYVNALNVTASNIKAGAIDGQTITGATMRTSSSGRRVQMNSLGIRSYNSSNQRHGFGLNTYGELELYNGGLSIGGIRYDTSGAGTTTEAKNRMFITTSRNYAMKLESSGDMSLDAPTIHFKGEANFVNADVTGLRMSDLPAGVTVVEEGSNSSGRWIKFSNGVMICTANISTSASNFVERNTTVSGDIKRSRLTAVSMPQTFKQVWYANFGVLGGSAIAIRTDILGTKLQYGSSTETPLTSQWGAPAFFHTSTISSSNTAGFVFFAIGSY